MSEVPERPAPATTPAPAQKKRRESLQDVVDKIMLLDPTKSK
jgi:hypothetical protein